MRREEAIVRIVAHEAELRARGITRVALGGAMAADADDGERIEILIDAANLGELTIDDLFALMQCTQVWLSRPTIVMPRAWAEAGHVNDAPATFDIF